MADPQDILNQISQMTSGYAQQLQRLAASMSNSTATVNAAAGQLKPTLSQVGQGMMRLRSEIDRGRISYDAAGRALNDLEQQFDQLDDTLKRSNRGQTIRNQQMAMSSELVGQAFGQLAADLAKISIAGYFNYFRNQVVTGTRAFQENVGAVEMSARVQKQATEDLVKTLGNMEVALSAATVGLAGFAPEVAILTGFAASVVGMYKAVKEEQQTAVDLLSTELIKTTVSFKDMTSVGALFANGMTEMRDAAGAAVLDLKSFADLTKNNAGFLTQLGGSVTNGIRRFTEINKEMLAYRKGLLNLGYTVDEQADLTVTYMEMLQRAGQLEGRTAADIAKGTDAYLTNLKAITAFTGEDAKKAAARAREASTQLAVQAELRNMDAKASERFQAAIGVAPEFMKKAIQQSLAGRGAIVDPDIQVALNSVPAARELLDRTMANIRDSSLTQKEITDRYQADLKRLGPLMEQQALAAGNSIGIANLFAGSLENPTRILEQFAEMGRKGVAGAKEGSKNTTDSADALKATTDRLTTSVSDAEVKFRELSAVIANELTVPLKTFVDTGLLGSKGLVQAVQDAADKINLTIKAIKGLGSFEEANNAMKRRSNNIPPPAPNPSSSGVTPIPVPRGEGLKPDNDALLAPWQKGKIYEPPKPLIGPDFFNSSSNAIRVEPVGTLAASITDQSINKLADAIKVSYSTAQVNNTTPLVNDLTSTVKAEFAKLDNLTINPDRLATFLAQQSDNTTKPVPVDFKYDTESMTRNLGEVFSKVLIDARRNDTNQNAQTVAVKNDTDTNQTVAALETLMRGPGGLSQLIADLKTHLTESNTQQLEALQTQVARLETLIDHTRDNVRYSERIANELA